MRACPQVPCAERPCAEDPALAVGGASRVRAGTPAGRREPRCPATPSSSRPIGARVLCQVGRTVLLALLLGQGASGMPPVLPALWDPPAVRLTPPSGPRPFACFGPRALTPSLHPQSPQSLLRPPLLLPPASLPFLPSVQRVPAPISLSQPSPLNVCPPPAAPPGGWSPVPCGPLRMLGPSRPLPLCPVSWRSSTW